ncbi:MAG: ABC transporter ATP-binding protein [Candidatus Dormibacteria bacterium]
MTAVSLRGVSKSFGRTPVLRQLELRVAPGGLLAVLGQSGSGKTTLLRLIAGLERPDQGQIELEGQVVDDGGARFVRPERRGVGYVPQEGALFPHLTVAENVGFGLGRGQRGRARVEDLIRMVGLEGLASRYPHQLSGGQQQRVALARALAVRPRLLLLDEPFSALDPGLRASVREDVRRILDASGVTTLLVTHDQEEALAVADQVAVLRRGLVAQVGAPEQVYLEPVDLELALFLGEANLFEGVVRGGVAQTPLGPVGLRRPGGATVPEGPATILVRPEQVAIGDGERGEGLRGRVSRVEYHGHDSVVAVLPEPPSEVGPIQVRIPGRPDLRVGAPVTVAASGAAQAFPRAPAAAVAEPHPEGA